MIGFKKIEINLFQTIGKTRNIYAFKLKNSF